MISEFEARCEIYHELKQKYRCSHKVCGCQNDLIERCTQRELCVCRECGLLCAKCSVNTRLKADAKDFNARLTPQRKKYLEINVAYSQFLRDSSEKKPEFLESRGQHCRK